ncbi:MAG: S-layer homology domain-containing protein [Synechococcaceae cyanobacterium SM2_3_1]|nr:S-layer homology domain-containing protein [Synechococcaceae cyanobacterium SM2_3_1]
MAPLQAATFYDTNGHWAEAYIDALSNNGVLNGFPDGTFRPDQLVTRAQFATIVNTAFRLPRSSGFVAFRDLPPNHWAADAVSTATANNLVAGFPDGTFRPEEAVTRTQTWVVLVNGLGNVSLPVGQPATLFQRYRDAATIPNWALSQVATADQAQLIVPYPDPTLLEPNRAATRAEVAAFTYQALQRQGQAGVIGQNPLPQTPVAADFDVRLSTVPAGTLVQIASNAVDRVLIAPNETRPFSLITLNPIRNPQGEILVPYGSRVDGRFEPAPGGTRFVAESIIIQEQVFPLAAQSDVIPDVKDPRQTNRGQVAQDAAIGAAAGAILGLVTGDQVIATEEVLAAGAAGAAIGNFTAPRVSILSPQQPLSLRLTQDLTTLR